MKELYIGRQVLVDWKRPPAKLYTPGSEEIRRIIRGQYGHGVGFMPAPSYQMECVSAQVDGTASTSTTENDLVPAAAKWIMPAGFIYRIGQRFHIHATGRISNIVTTPGTLTLRFRMGPTANIIAAASRAIQLNAVAKTNVGWELEWYFTVRAIGAATACNWMHNGMFTSESVVLSPAGSSGAAALQDAPVVGTGFDSTVANLTNLTGQFSLTGNSQTLHTYGLESLN